jgi:hypothetical protein
MLFEGGDGLRSSVFRDVDVLFHQAGNGLPLATSYDHVYDYDA